MKIRAENSVEHNMNKSVRSGFLVLRTLKGKCAQFGAGVRSCTKHFAQQKSFVFILFLFFCVKFLVNKGVIVINLKKGVKGGKKGKNRKNIKTWADSVHFARPYTHQDETARLAG